MTKDFLNQDLHPGDAVVLVAGQYTDLRRGIVTAFTPKKVRVMVQSQWVGLTSTDTILIFPDQCVMVNTEETRAQDGPWEHLRQAIEA